MPAEVVAAVAAGQLEQLGASELPQDAVERAQRGGFEPAELDAVERGLPALGQLVAERVRFI
jgi:hypothetical protein